jgi:hypothetical protein
LDKGEDSKQNRSRSSWTEQSFRTEKKILKINENGRTSLAWLVRMGHMASHFCIAFRKSRSGV